MFCETDGDGSCDDGRRDAELWRFSTTAKQWQMIDFTGSPPKIVLAPTVASDGNNILYVCTYAWVGADPAMCSDLGEMECCVAGRCTDLN